MDTLSLYNCNCYDFMGSGTTAVACQELGRTFIGCEIDTNYFSLVEKRLKIKEK